MQLPNLTGKTIYLDLETTSWNKKLDSLNPFHNCDIAGICICDDTSPGFYIPVQHHIEGELVDGNYSKEQVYKWLKSTLRSCDSVVCHNASYDINVLLNGTDIQLPPRIIDTITAAKLLFSDRLSYGLKELSREWLGRETFDSRLAPYLVGNKDFGQIPIDVITPYGIEDAEGTRALYRYIKKRMPAECNDIWEVEIQLTRILIEMEQAGLRLDTHKLPYTRVATLTRLVQIEEELLKLVKWEFNPSSNKQCQQLLIESYGLPVVERTDKGNPSFSKQALDLYLQNIDAPTEIVELIIEYRSLKTFNGLFLEPYASLHNASILHPSYNQIVRTGRMSCKQPNFMQLNKKAKELIIPREGHSFLSVDYSNIEFRCIAHYCKDEEILRQWNKDPELDFHTIVAEEIGIDRRAAKTFNFAAAFGMGKAKTVTRLSVNKEFVSDLQEKCNGDEELFRIYAKQRAIDAYHHYHNRFSSIKPTAQRATEKARAVGFVRTLSGRRRHLPGKVAHIAFNTANQGTAADIVKERVVAVHKQLPSDVHLRTIVHDEILFECPTERVEEVAPDIVECLQENTYGLRVPIRVKYDHSNKNWREAVA